MTTFLSTKLHRGMQMSECKPFIGRFSSLVSVACAWAIGGCLGPSDPNKVDSESHFLTICSGDSDCEASSCICGFCTTTCVAGGSDECGLCLESDTFGTACEAERPGVTLCGAGCTKDSECGEGALGFVCDRTVGACVQGLASEVRVVPGGVLWPRCPAGQTWDGSSCVGRASEVFWEVASQRCAANGGGSRLPTLQDVQELLGGCSLLDEELGRPYVCNACSESATCSVLFGDFVPDGLEWVSTLFDEGGASAWSYTVIDGRIDNTVISSPVNFRCVRDPR